MSKLKKYSLILMAIVMVAVSALTVYAADPTTGSLTIIAHEQRNGDTTTNPPIKGIEYTIYKVDDTIDDTWDAYMYVENNSVQGIAKVTDTNGTIVYDNLELGRYYVEMTKVIDGVKENSEFLVDVPTTNPQGSGLIYDVVVEPKISTLYKSLEITKKDSAGNPVSGVTFKVQASYDYGNGSLENINGEWGDYIPEGSTEVLRVTTDESGKIQLLNLPYRVGEGVLIYRLVEESAPDGYIINNSILDALNFSLVTSPMTDDENFEGIDIYGWLDWYSYSKLDYLKQFYTEVSPNTNLTTMSYINEKPEITKKVKNSAGEFVKSAGINSTDTVTFKITTDVPLQISDMKTYKISDTLPEGLILDRDSITIEGTITSGSEVIPTDLYTLSNNGLEITFDTSKMYDSEDSLKTPLYSSIIVTYDATVNMESITIGGNGNINTASLTYTDNISESYYENGSWDNVDELSTYTTTDTAEVHTGALKIEKVEKGNTTNKLAGAKFKIATTEANAEAGTFVKDANGNDIEVETNANGLAEIKGLAYADDGSDTSYWLVETQAPTYEDRVDGQAVTKSYNLLQNPVEVQIGKTTYDTAVTIQNSKGLDLPATGGIGIAIFAVVGITLMVISKKMSKEEIK